MWFLYGAFPLWYNVCLCRTQRSDSCYASSRTLVRIWSCIRPSTGSASVCWSCFYYFATAPWTWRMELWRWDVSRRFRLMSKERENKQYIRDAPCLCDFDGVQSLRSRFSSWWTLERLDCSEKTICTAGSEPNEPSVVFGAKPELWALDWRTKEKIKGGCFKLDYISVLSGDRRV